MAISSTPPLRYWMSAAQTVAWSRKPWVSTRTWCFLPLIFLPPLEPGESTQPSFSTLLTLWLLISSTHLRLTIAAFGLASRPASSRHATNNT